MANAVYVLCALTSVACALMLWRGYRRSGARLLLWSCLCFVALAVNNLLLAIGNLFIPHWVLEQAELRVAVALAGLAMLLYGLVWDVE